jgi:hypothetical protein
MADKGKTVDFSNNDVIVNSIVLSDGGVTGRVITANNSAPVSVTTTTSTYTAANLLTGIIVNSAATAVTATLDTAANIVAAVNSGYPQGANVGDLIVCEIINGGSSTGAITVGAGTGGTFDTNVPAAN